MDLRRVLEEIVKDPAMLLKYLPDPPRLSPSLNKRIDQIFHPRGEEDLKDPAKLLKYLPDPPRLAPSLNKRIDQIFHPRGEEDLKDPAKLFLDSLAHFIVEQADSAVQSFAKTVRYNISKVVGHMGDSKGNSEENIKRKG